MCPMSGMLRILFWGSLVVMVTALDVQAEAARALVLVAGGQARATIVLPKEPQGHLRDAARDLQHYVQRISGVSLPIRADGRRVSGTGIYIDVCEPTEASDVPSEDHHLESHAITVRGGDLYLTGRQGVGSAFAVRSFIEQDLGVRWFAPGELWEVVPEGTPGELALQVTSRVIEPDTSPRAWSGFHWHRSWMTWRQRNKAVEGEIVSRRNFQNNLFRIFAPSLYGESHPAYYPLWEGQRWIPPSDRYLYWFPCTSNPEVVRLTVEAARTFFDENPNIDSFSLGQDDIVQICGCEGCRAMDARPDDYDVYKRRKFSDRYYKFINQVAREVRKTHPDRYLGALIYNIAREVPETVDRLEPNVFGFLTENCFAWWQPGQRERDQAITRQWAERVEHLSRYDYYGLGTFTPRFAPRLMAEQMQLDKQLGLEGMYIEFYTFLPHTAPMIWAMAKLQWDATLEIDALLGEFYEKLYGTAAPAMRRYFDALEAAWLDPRPERKLIWEFRQILTQVQAMTVTQLAEAESLLDAAQAAATDPQVRERIGIHQDALRYSGYGIRTFDLVQRLQATPVQDAASARRVLALARQLAELSTAREAFWASAATRTDLLGETIDALARAPRFFELDRIATIEQMATGPMMLAFARLAPTEKPEDLAMIQAVRAAMAQAGSAFLRDFERLAPWHRGATATNLVRNGDFEQWRPGTGEAKPGASEEPADWVHEGVPAHWSYWSRYLDFGGIERGLSEDQGVDGSRAVSMRIAGGEPWRYRYENIASFLQPVPVQGGHWYLVSARFRTDPGIAHGAGRLMAQFRLPDGRRHDAQGLEPVLEVVADPEVPGAWQTLTLLTQAPADAVALVVNVGAGVRDDVTIHIDQVEVYQVAAADESAGEP